MAHHVRYSLPHGQRQHRLLRCAQSGRRGKALHLELHSSRGQCIPCGVNLCGQAACPVAANRLTNLGKRSARRLFHITNLLNRARSILASFQQPGRQLRLQHNDAQRMSENIVQIAGDAFSLGHGSECLNLLMRHVERVSRALLLGEENVASAYHSDKEHCEGYVVRIAMKQPRLADDQDRLNDKEQKHLCRRSDQEGDKGGSVNKERDCTCVRRKRKRADNIHPDDAEQAYVNPAQPQERNVEHHKCGSKRERNQPIAKRMAEERINEVERKICKPQIIDALESSLRIDAIDLHCCDSSTSVAPVPSQPILVVHISAHKGDPCAAEEKKRKAQQSKHVG